MKPLKLFGLSSIAVVTLLNLIVVSGIAQERPIEQEISRLRQIVDVGTNGGDTYLFDFDLTTFDYGQVIRETRSYVRDSSCSYVLAAGRKAVLKSIREFASFRESSEATKIVRSWHRRGLLKAAVGFYWDGAEGDSEYCSSESVTFYFTDGQALTIDFDSTT